MVCEHEPGLEFLRTNADDRLSLDPIGGIEGGNSVIEGRNLADVCL